MTSAIHNSHAFSKENRRRSLPLGSSGRLLIIPARERSRCTVEFGNARSSGTAPVARARSMT